jgi:hypothetical protein
MRNIRKKERIVHLMLNEKYQNNKEGALLLKLRKEIYLSTKRKRVNYQE